MVYTKDEVLTDMCIGTGSGPPIDDERLYEYYTLEEVELTKIVLFDADELTEPLTYKNWLEYSVFDKLDYEGLHIVTGLMFMYSENIPVRPILLADDFDIVDGRHRFAAANSLGIKSLLMYVPITKGE